MDFEVVSALVHISSAPSNFSKTVRLMAGNNLVSEGFQQGQVGSSAMPHKTNTRTSERINGLSLVLKGYLSMVGGLVGDQWNEGDVSCSVVRRVALPDSFFAIDGLFQSFLTVLDEFGSFPAVIEKELSEELPYLSTTRLLVAAVQKGIGRETAHEIISEHARTSSMSRRENLDGPSLVELLDLDNRFPLNEEEMNQLFNQRTVLIGNALNQVQLVIEKIADIVTHRPLAASYKPESII